MHRAARSASGSFGSWARSNVLVPMRCPWQSHIPGITAVTLVTKAPGVAGATAAGPA